MTHSALQAPIESVLFRCRARGGHLTRQGAADRYTGGCAAVLGMEADRLQLTPLLIAAEIQTEQQRRFPAVFIGEAR